MLGTPLKKAFAVCRNGVAHGKQEAVCRVPKTHGKGLFAHGKVFAVCCTRQSLYRGQTDVGKEVLCRVLFIGHTANSLPTAKKHSAKKFSENRF